MKRREGKGRRGARREERGGDGSWNRAADWIKLALDSA